MKVAEANQGDCGSRGAARRGGAGEAACHHQGRQGEVQGQEGEALIQYAGILEEPAGGSRLTARLRNALLLALLVYFCLLIP